MNAAVTTSGLGKRYRNNWALRDCDLTLPTGRVIALVGPNGAGKTTLLQLAAGLIRPTTGSVALFGELAPAESASALAQMAFVAQDHPLYRRFRVRELLHLGRALNGGWDQDLAERRLADLDIPLDRPAGRLSGGQQAQLALTLALAKRPRLLILDEPVASLDPLARRDFMKTLMATVADGEGDFTVLLSSHNVGELERVCDHLVLITDGRVQLAGDIDDAPRQPPLADRSQHARPGRTGGDPRGPWRPARPCGGAGRRGRADAGVGGAPGEPGGAGAGLPGAVAVRCLRDVPREGAAVMIWLIWRQHRGELLGAAVLLAVLGLFLLLHGIPMHDAYERDGVEACQQLMFSGPAAGFRRVLLPDPDGLREPVLRPAAATSRPGCRSSRCWPGC